MQTRSRMSEQTPAQLAAEEIINTPSLLNVNMQETAAKATLTEIITRHLGDGRDKERIKRLQKLCGNLAAYVIEDALDLYEQLKANGQTKSDEFISLDNLFEKLRLAITAEPQH